jgi:hypothetical protein
MVGRCLRSGWGDGMLRQHAEHLHHMVDMFTLADRVSGCCYYVPLVAAVMFWFLGKGNIADKSLYKSQK